MAITPRKQVNQECTGRIRVMVVDDHAQVRHCLHIYLSTCADIEVVAEAGGAEDALRQFVLTRPHVVVMDLAMPGMDGVAVTRRMRRIDAGSQIIALTSFLDPEVSRRALQAGAACCLVKDASVGALLEAIRDAGRADWAGYMTIVQAKTGEATEAKTRVPSDGRSPVTAYDGCTHECGRRSD